MDKFATLEPTSVLAATKPTPQQIGKPQTGSRGDDDDALLEVKWTEISLEDAGLMPVIGRVAREDIYPVI